MKWWSLPKGWGLGPKPTTSSAHGVHVWGGAGGCGLVYVNANVHELREGFPNTTSLRTKKG
jgi:hypothetical protein